MFVPRKGPTPASISAAARAETSTFNVSNPERWNRLMKAMQGVETLVVGHAIFKFRCPCCHLGVGMGGQATDGQGVEHVVASCENCDAGFDDIVNKTPREPKPLNTGGFVPRREPAPQYQAPRDEGPIRRFLRKR